MEAYYGTLIGLSHGMVSFSITLSDPNPGFKVTYLQVEYFKKRCIIGLLKNANRKSILSNDTIFNE